MKAMAPVRPTDLNQCRIRIPAVPIAAALARDEIREAIDAWAIKIDKDDAVLLTSELVTNVIKHVGAGDIVLTIGCCECEFRVDVQDSSNSFPRPVPVAVDSETGRGLVLVNAIADEWGYYRTPVGTGVFFVLNFLPELPTVGDAGELGI
ncbi:MAG TPA: ATP-binding protein [Trebonia sp.]|jgi:anti-sigma regulatory factor (Ser/Thr protein kinase)|nr:ATP-binding protein [Trebonia sp.]